MTPESAAPQSEQVAAFFQKHRTGLVTLVFTDLVDSVALLSRLGDQAGATFMQRRRQIVREVLQGLPEGEEIETAGDSFLLAFAKPSDGVRFALQSQARLRRFSAESNVAVQERIGIHLGEVVIAENETVTKAKDFYGIQLATCFRVMSLAAGGQVLLTRGAFDSARQVLKGEDLPGVGGLQWVSHGPYLLKGIDEAVEVCEVGELGQSPLSAPKTSEKAQRQVRPDEEPVLGWRPAVGQEVPNTKWVLEEKLGEGGFGEVWVGRHQTLKEQHVFKFCFRADRIRSLKREVTLFRLMKERAGEHPGVVRIHNVYFDEPPFYLEEEYVEGKDLKTWCEAQGGIEKVPQEVRLEIVVQAAEALQVAHDAGIILRDVKPGNILVSGDASGAKPPAVKLTDFGIGQVISAEYLKGVTQAGFTQTILGSTSTGTGTTMYLAPEIVAGMPATTRSDIYSLGVVLYQLVVGEFRRPVTGDWADEVEDSLLRDDLKHCLAGKPEERFAGVAHLATNLRVWEPRKVEVARRQAEEAERERFRQKAEQRHRLFVAAAGAALVLATIAVALGYGFWRAQQARELAEAYAYAADMNLTQQALLADDLGKARTLLDRYRPGTGREHLRGFEWRYLAAEARSDSTATDTSSAGSAFRLALSPDGRTLAVGRLPGTIELWDPASLTCKATLETNAVEAMVAFSPAGNLLAASGPSGVLRLWQLEPRQVIGELVHTNAAICLSFSPDGRQLASFHRASGVCVWDLGSRQAVRRYAEFRNVAYHGGEVCFSPDGRHLAVGDRSGHIRILDWVADRVVADIPAHREPIMSLAYSPDGKLLASGSGYSADEIRLWTPATGEPAGSLAGHRGWIPVLQFSGDGRQLISGSGDQTIGIWDVPARRLNLRLRGHVDEVYSLAFDERWTNLVSGGKDGTLARWDIDKVHQSALRLDLPGWTTQPAYAIDGSCVAVLDQQGAVALWRPGQPRQLSVIAALGTNNAALATARRRGLLACATREGSVRIWSLQSANLVTNVAGHAGRICDLRFSNRQDFLLGWDWAGLVTVWDAKNWTKHSACAEANGAFRAALSPDGRLLVVATSGGRLNWWDVVLRHRLAETTGHRPGFGVAGLDFSPDGGTLASVSEDGTTALWDTRTRRRIAHWKADFLGIHTVAFSSDGSRLALGLSAGTAVRLWDMKTRRELVTLAAPGGLFYWVQFSPDDGALLCGSYDGHSYFWRTPSFAELNAAEKAQAKAGAASGR